MNTSQIVKQSAFDAAMCAVPAIMPRLTRCTTVSVECELFGLVNLAVNYHRVPADADHGAEATIDISTVYFISLLYFTLGIITPLPTALVYNQKPYVVGSLHP